MAEDPKGISRRTFGIGALAAGGGMAVGGTGIAGASAVQPGPPSSQPVDRTLINGKFVTEDQRNTQSRAVSISDGRVAEVGRNARKIGRVVDLEGATVAPGLIDSHQHFVRACRNPGNQTRAIEPAVNIGELLEARSKLAEEVPAGEFLTCIGGWYRHGLAEGRLPTPVDLYAAAPQLPVYLSETQGGAQAVTNSLGRVIFEAVGLPVDPMIGVLAAAAARAALVPYRRQNRSAKGCRMGSPMLRVSA